MAKQLATLAGLDLMGMEDVPEDYGRWLIHGPQGSGKTTLASTLAALGPMLYIDLVGEKGIRSFKGAPYADNITVVRPNSITKLDELFWALDKGDAKDAEGRPFVSVCVDSLTSVQKMAMRFMLGHSETAVREIVKGNNPADQRTWGQTLDIMTDMATFWYGLADGNRARPMHVVMTAQTKVVDDEITLTTTRTPDVQRGALSITLASPDYIIYAEEEEDLDNADDDGNVPTRYVLKFGGHPGYRTKARIPVPLRGKLPSVIGRAWDEKANAYKSPDLAQLSRILGIGGAAKAASK